MKEKVERKYKDTVFRMLFRDRKNLLELYNAVNGTDYDNADELEVITLENAIYLNVKNDVACIFSLRMQLYEHQSTVNPNMPLRDLIYVSREFEAYLQKNNMDIYSKKQLSLPTPRFIVFYNGTEEQPERTELKLSDAFALKEEVINLELRVEVYNINLGYNRHLMEACRTLREYCIYVGKIRDYARWMEIEKAVDRAVNECIKENILQDFLTNQKAEAKAMSIFEYDEEKTRKLWAKEDFEDGVKKGEKKGREEERQKCIIAFLKNGGTEEQAVSMLEVTPEEVRQAKEELKKGEVNVNTN